MPWIMTSEKTKIAIGGFQHQTNTFAPHLAHYENFVGHDGWPGLSTGRGLIDVMKGSMPSTSICAARW